MGRLRRRYTEGSFQYQRHSADKKEPAIIEEKNLRGRLGEVSVYVLVGGSNLGMWVKSCNMRVIHIEEGEDL